MTLDNTQLFYDYIYVSAKSLPFYIFLHNMTRYAAFCNTIFSEIIKINKKTLKNYEMCCKKTYKYKEYT